MGSFGRILRPVFDPGVAVAVAPPWWPVAGKTCVAAYQPKGAASLAASYVNLANPGTYDAAPGVAPTWASATGWTFNGSTQYLTTGVVPTNNQAWSMLVRFSNRTNVGSLSRLLGDTSTYPRFGFYQDASNVYYYNSDVAAKAPAMSAGVVAVVGNNGYRDGVSEALAIGTKSGSFLSGGLTLGCSRDGASSYTQYIAANIQAVAIYSATLTAGEVATVSAAMAAL